MKQHQHFLNKRLVASLMLFALIATACGNGVAQSTTERAAAPESAAIADAGADPETGGHQYGASLEEFAATARAAEDLEGTSASADNEAAAPIQSEYATIVWDDLIPEGSSSEEILDRYMARIDEVEPGSPEASELYEELQAEFDPTAINTNLDGQKIRLAGFVAPLTYVGETVTEFLLVPNFGACIHVPPPPPNQTVMVVVGEENGLSVDDTWGAVWVEGIISVSPATTDLAEVSYRIDEATTGVYNDF